MIRRLWPYRSRERSDDALVEAEDSGAPEHARLRATCLAFSVSLSQRTALASRLKWMAPVERQRDRIVPLWPYITYHVVDTLLHNVTGLFSDGSVDSPAELDEGRTAICGPYMDSPYKREWGGA